MKSEINSILSSLQRTSTGHPWYGRAVYEIIKESSSDRQYIRPTSNSHSLAELLYHMVTWAEFVQKRIEKEPIKDMAAFDALDWRPIDPDLHDMEKGLMALQAAHNNIIALLQEKDDSFLEEKCDYRDYNFDYLLNGLIQHNIYHLGQIAYLHKLLA
ncbi:MAG: DinB family protein [Chitinophagaceae bacterium]